MNVNAVSLLELLEPQMQYHLPLFPRQLATSREVRGDEQR